MSTAQKTFRRISRAARRANWPIALTSGSLLVITLAFLPTHAQQQSANSQTAASSPAKSSPSQSARNSPVSEPPESKAFPSPHAAAEALCAAARKNDLTDLMVVLGPDGKDLVAWSDGDNEAQQSDRELFVQKYDQMHRLVKEPDGTVALYVGAENWPLPIPLVEYKGAWYFDADLGKQEILYRQLGRNEIAALNVSDALIEAEKDYFNSTRSYTNKFTSAASSRDGLYWPSSNDANRSPIGRYLAQAGIDGSTAENHKCFHGYFYRILLENHVAPDGDARGSAANPNGSFAIVAFPAEYRSSGVMTFITESNGQSYEKDLGPTTASEALKITSFRLDNTWSKVE